MDLFGVVPEPLRPYLPSFRHALVDLTQIDNSALSTGVRLRAFLKALKYGRRSDLPDCLGIVLEEASFLEGKDLLLILTYLDRGPIAVDKSLMHETLGRLVPNRKEQIMGWFSQEYYDKGQAVGEAKVLARLLETRFGALPASLRQRIFAADLSSIEGWVERAFSAPDLQSVFEAN
jgi:hypothetical protein